MSKNKNQIFSSEETLAAVIEHSKRYKERYKMSITTAFEDSLLSCYKYSESWYRHHNGETMRYYDFDEYKEIFYRFIVGNLLFLPKLIRIYATSYYRDSQYSKEPDLNVVKELKNHAKKLLDERKALERLEQEETELIQMLGHQSITLAVEKVLPLYELEKAGKFIKGRKSDILIFSLYMFNYGYILGKRKERAKKHS